VGTKWKMPLAVIGKPTGDGRQFDEGALSHRDLPLPFRYVAQDSGGHQNAVIVGHISRIGKEKDGLLPAQGEFYDDDSWPEDVRNHAIAAMKFTNNKVIGPSVDLDQQEVEHVPEPKAYAAWKKEQAGKLKAAKMAHSKLSGSDCGCGEKPIFAEEAYDGPRLKMIRSGRMASATLVHIPAFAELSGHAKLTPIDSSDPNVGGTTSSAVVAGVDFAWDEVVWLDGDKIENDGEFGAAQEECSDEMSETIIPRKKKKLDPEKVKGNQDDEDFSTAYAEDPTIWMSDAEYYARMEEFAKKRLPSKDKASGGMPSAADAEQSQGATYAPDVTKADVRKKLSDEDFVDPEGRRFPIASCADVPDAVSSYGRANPKIPYGKFKARLTAIAKRKGCEGSLPDSWKAGEKMAALMASAGATFAPEKSAFDNPKFTGPRPLHVADDRTVSGHVAIWETCHVGIGDSCVKPPKSNTGYAYFHTGEVVTADGARVPVGRLTYGGGHAKPNLGYAAAAEHYDRTSQVGAYVRAGEDEYGIWVAGVLAPDADEDAVRAMRAAPLSGDWRRIGGNLEMVAALHVNTAGFPIPRMLTASADEQELYSLVAAGALPRVIDEGEPETTFTTAALGGLDTTELGRAIARGMIAENKAIEEQAARAAEWRELVASATTDTPADDYDGALGDLFVALVE
jgi:hypothetical protein